MTVLVTGAAGFIGFHLIKQLLEAGFKVVGIDNINNYYDVNLKNSRLKELFKLKDELNSKFYFEKVSIESNSQLENIFKNNEPTSVVNLAAQAGVRYSLVNPSAYITSNIVGFHNLIELSKKFNVKNFLYASSSSVYGGNLEMPFKEINDVSHPVSLYAATKRSNELIAHTYSNLYNLPTTGLRFFTVYGPWGRPDMALFLFTKAIINDEPIEVFNNGQMIRDFTYIDDVVESIVKLIDKPATSLKEFNKHKPNPAVSWAPYRLFNIGNSKPIKLMEYISAIESSLNKKAIIKFLPMQMGDVKATFADTDLLNQWIGFKPKTSVNIGVKKFVDWYVDFYS